MHKLPDDGLGRLLRWLLFGLAAFGALSAIGGGIALVASPAGSGMVPFTELASTAFRSFLIPGILLAVVVGGTSLLAAVLVLVRSRLAIDSALLAGGAATVWMTAELAQLPGVHWLQVVYGLQGLALLLLAVAAAWRSPRPRHRWVVAVGLAETIGVLFPMSAGVLGATAGLGGAAHAALITGAGLLEGLALGAGQAWVLPLPVRRWRYVGLTAAGAAVAWGSILGGMALARAGGPWRLGAAVVLLPVGLFAIAAAQWSELRHHSPAAGRWIGWTVLAWAVALPLSFLPSPLIDASTPVARQLVLLGCGGALMAYVMALVTWPGVRSVASPAAHPALPKKLAHELRALHLPEAHGEEPVISEADLAPLPEPARRYLRFMGVVGRPRDWSFRIAFTGRFRPGAGKQWMSCKAWQYNDALATARVFHLRGRMAGLPVLARDTYVAGHGRMRVRLLDRFTVADGTGEAFDVGELVTYLNDAVTMAPSMLLIPQVRWSEVDANSFDVSFTHAGHTVTARVFVDVRGAPTDFSTSDRFYVDPQLGPVRARWTTPIAGWQRVGERMLPTRGQAIWHLPGGALPYADFTPVPGSVAFNVAPGA